MVVLVFVSLSPSGLRRGCNTRSFLAFWVDAIAGKEFYATFVQRESMTQVLDTGVLGDKWEVLGNESNRGDSIPAEARATLAG